MINQVKEIDLLQHYRILVSEIKLAGLSHSEVIKKASVHNLALSPKHYQQSNNVTIYNKLAQTFNKLIKEKNEN